MFFSQSRKDRRGNNKKLCVIQRLWRPQKKNQKNCVTLRLCARLQKKKQKTLRYSASLREIFIIFVEYFYIDYDSQNI